MPTWRPPRADRLEFLRPGAIEVARLRGLVVDLIVVDIRFAGVFDQHCDAVNDRIGPLTSGALGARIRPREIRVACWTDEECTHVPRRRGEYRSAGGAKMALQSLSVDHRFVGGDELRIHEALPPVQEPAPDQVVPQEADRRTRGQAIPDFGLKRPPASCRTTQEIAHTNAAALRARPLDPSPLLRGARSERVAPRTRRCLSGSRAAGRV